MYERFGHTSRQLVVAFLSSIFKYQTKWGNVDRPSISFAGTASPDIFEEFAKEPEKYPCIVVGNRGSQQQAAAIDGFISHGAYTETWGDYPSFYTVIGNGAKAAIKATPEAAATWHTATADLRWASGGDYVVVSLASGSDLSTATTITSGSVKPFRNAEVLSKLAAFTTPTDVNRNAEVWLTLGTDGEVTYYLCGDNSKASGKPKTS